MIEQWLITKLLILLGICFDGYLFVGY